MKRAWTRGEKWLWAAPLLFGLAAAITTFGPGALGRLLGWPQSLTTTPNTIISSMALSGNGEILAAGGSRRDEKGNWKTGSGTVHLWNARTGKALAEIPPVYTRDAKGFTVGFNIHGLALSPDAKTIGFTRGVRRWDLYDVSTQRQLWSIPDFVIDAQFSSDSSSIVLYGDKQVWIVDASNGKVRSQWKRSDNFSSFDIDLSHDEKLVATIKNYPKNYSEGLDATSQSDIEFHSTDTGKLVRVIQSSNVESVKFSPDNQQLVVAGYLMNSTKPKYENFAPVRCYDVTSGKLIWEVKSPAFGGADFRHSAFCDAIFSSDGRTIAAYQNNNSKVFLLDSTTGKIKTTLSLGRATSSNSLAPPGLAFSPDSKRLFARGKNAILFWDLP